MAEKTQVICSSSDCPNSFKLVFNQFFLMSENFDMPRIFDKGIYTSPFIIYYHKLIMTFKKNPGGV